MRNPENVLNSLSKHSGNLNYKFERLYRVLFNVEMFYVAYQNIYSKTGNMTAGVDGKTIDGMSIDRVEQLIGSLKNETYQPNPSKRTYIPKKNGKKRPLGIPSFNDKMVQEVVRMILEAIYEGSFETYFTWVPSQTKLSYRSYRHTKDIHCHEMVYRRRY